MNNNFSNQGNFPGTPLFSDGNMVPNQQNQMNYQNTTFEQSYIENILRLNRGKKVKIFASYPDSNEWRDKVFEGIVEQSGRDHIILSDPKTGEWYLILIIYVNYIEFDERIISNPEFYPNN
ncbi:MAG: spore coat protein GerQ [Bacilli bacterium]|nr:spore coat protein GerQ [Bacilli bacterium]